MSSSSDKALIIFVKNPQPGKVKTRLEASLGPDATLKVYRTLIALTFDAAERVDADVFVYFTPVIANNAGLPDRFYLRLQQNGDLGKRMKAAFRELFDEGYERICIIGSDCPQLRTHHLDQAFAALTATDIVAGPAEDGGYYLMGMNKDHTRIFGLSDWSHGQVYQQTLELIRNEEASFTQLEKLSDLDTVEDYRVLAHHLDAHHPVSF